MVQVLRLREVGGGDGRWVLRCPRPGGATGHGCWPLVEEPQHV